MGASAPAPSRGRCAPPVVALAALASARSSLPTRKQVDRRHSKTPFEEIASCKRGRGGPCHERCVYTTTVVDPTFQQLFGDICDCQGTSKVHPRISYVDMDLSGVIQVEHKTHVYIRNSPRALEHLSVLMKPCTWCLKGLNSDRFCEIPRPLPRLTTVGRVCKIVYVVFPRDIQRKQNP